MTYISANAPRHQPQRQKCGVWIPWLSTCLSMACCEAIVRFIFLRTKMIKYVSCCFLQFHGMVLESERIYWKHPMDKQLRKTTSENSCNLRDVSQACRASDFRTDFFVLSASQRKKIEGCRSCRWYQGLTAKASGAASQSLWEGSPKNRLLFFWIYLIKLHLHLHRHTYTSFIAASCKENWWEAYQHTAIPGMREISVSFGSSIAIRP